MIRTHVLAWFGGCRVWVWEWLTPREWRVLGHIARGAAAITVVCGGAAGVAPLVPSLYAPAPPSEQIVGGGPSVPVDVPEPGSLGLVVVGIGFLAWARRR